MTEDEFIEIFEPEAHPDGSYYVLHDYGTEAERRLLEQRHQARRLWTLVEGDEAQLVILSGFHYVNRLGYIVCAVPYAADASLEIRCD